MILIPHILVGAVIGAKIKHFGWIVILGLISHLILDRIPHWDYANDALKKFVKNKCYKILFVFILQVIIDALIGLAIVFLIVWKKELLNLRDLQFISAGILVSILPDFLLGIASIVGAFYNKFKKITTGYINFHKNVLHHPKHIKKPTWLGVSTQILVSIIAILILLL